MKIFVLFIFLFMAHDHSHAGSFSTIFGSEGASSVGNPKARSLSYTLQYLTFTGISGYVAKQLFETGFLEPIGFTPESYESLSPLAYQKKKIFISQKQKLLTQNKSRVFQLNRLKSFKTPGEIRLSEFMQQSDKRESLLKEYFNDK